MIDLKNMNFNPNDIENGDLVFFNGTVFTSFVTQLVDGGTSHVGMAHKVGNDVFIMHSVSEHSFGGQNNFAGIQLTNLTLMWNVQMYNKMIVMRTRLTKNQYAKCKEKFLSLYGLPYDFNPVYSWFSLREPTNSYNCIQLMVAMLSHAGAISNVQLRLHSLKNLFEQTIVVTRYSKTTCGNIFACLKNREATDEERQQGKMLARSLLLK
jgi:hypothetical protein